MRKFFEIPVLFMVTLVFTASMAIAKDYVIYSISQDIPMGVKDEKLKKNFYINMGKTQGLKAGSNVDVFRVISILDPYMNKNRFNHKVKIGKLKIIHSEDASAIARLEKLESGDNVPVLDVAKIMVGDLVEVKTK